MIKYGKVIIYYLGTLVVITMITMFLEMYLPRLVTGIFMITSLAIMWYIVGPIYLLKKDKER